MSIGLGAMTAGPKALKLAVGRVLIRSEHCVLSSRRAALSLVSSKASRYNDHEPGAERVAIVRRGGLCWLPTSDPSILSLLVSPTTTWKRSRRVPYPCPYHSALGSALDHQFSLLHALFSPLQSFRTRTRHRSNLAPTLCNPNGNDHLPIARNRGVG